MIKNMKSKQETTTKENNILKKNHANKIQNLENKNKALSDQINQSKLDLKN